MRISLLILFVLVLPLASAITIDAAGDPAEQVVVTIEQATERIQVNWSNLVEGFDERTGFGTYDLSVCAYTAAERSCADARVRLNVSAIPQLRLRVPNAVSDAVTTIPINFKWAVINVYPARDVWLRQAHCRPSWSCSPWSPHACSDRSITELVRSCTDANGCITDFARPPERQACEYGEPAPAPPPPPEPPPAPPPPDQASILPVLIIIGLALLLILVGLGVWWFVHRSKRPKRRPLMGKPLDVTIKDFILFRLKQGYHPSQIKTMLMAKGYDVASFESFVERNFRAYLAEHPGAADELVQMKSD